MSWCCFVVTCTRYPFRHTGCSWSLWQTQARASIDYHLETQWTLGVSGIFSRALGLAPTKDNYWSETIQPENPYGKTEPYPRLQSVASTLSAGPVAPSDAIGYSNPDLINMACMTDGTLLQVRTSVRGWL